MNPPPPRKTEVKEGGEKESYKLQLAALALGNAFF